MIGDPSAPGGLWADVVFEVKGASWEGVESLIHQALGLELVPVDRGDEPVEEPYLVEGAVLGHNVLLEPRTQSLSRLRLGHEVWFTSSTIRPLASPLPNQPGCDISAALATQVTRVAHGLSQECVVHSTGAATPVDGPAPPRGTHFSFRFRTPSFSVEPVPQAYASRPPLPAGRPYPVHHPFLDGQHSRLMDTLRLYMNVWWDRESSGRNYVATNHLGMRIELELGTPEEPIHHLRGIWRGDEPTTDISEVMAPALWFVGSGGWDIEALDGYGSTTLRIPALATDATP